MKNQNNTLEHFMTCLSQTVNPPKYPYHQARVQHNHLECREKTHPQGQQKKAQSKLYTKNPGPHEPMGHPTSHFPKALHITLNWKEFINTLDHKTNTSKLYKTIKSITLSNCNTIQTHEGITSTDGVPTNKQQADAFIKYFSHDSHLKPHTNDVSRHKSHKSCTFHVQADKTHHPKSQELFCLWTRRHQQPTCQTARLQEAYRHTFIANQLCTQCHVQHLEGKLHHNFPQT